MRSIAGGMPDRSRATPRGEVAIGALAVCVGYYAGANLGFILRLPPATPSVMWPPNAILTTALLLTPPRRWWICLASALPAHLAAELQQSWLPPALVLSLFATNCSEAMIGAAFVRRFSDAPGRFDTLPRVVVFTAGVVLLAPFLSSFLDAMAVTATRGEPYWGVWEARFFSNVSSAVALVPALTIIITAGPPWLRRASLRRLLEPVLLAIALLALGIVVFNSAGFASVPGVPRSPLAFLTPLLLWAAVRFGPGGASLAILATALIAISAVTHGHGPFHDLPARTSVPALQILLTVFAVPLLFLAALIEERRRAEEALGARLGFEELLSRLSAAFVHLPSDEMDDAFDTWLERLGEHLRLDRLVLLRESEDGERLTVTHCWSARGAAVTRTPDLSKGATLRWSLGHEPLVVAPDDDALTPAASDDGNSRRSVLVVPLVAGGRVLGGLLFDAVTIPRRAAASIVPELQLVAEVFAGALARKESEDALRGSELMKSAILASLRTGVVVLDREGCIIAVNESWKRLMHEDPATAEVAVGRNYLELCRRRAMQGVAGAAEAVSGIQGVLERSQASFAFDYSDGVPADRWFAMTVVPLNRREGGAVVSYTDITERKRAETDAQRSRQELAHFTRVSTMGELSASLAHELSQPLSGILTNAQAAQRVLGMQSPDLGELGGILADIVDDDKRAGDVIHRLRDLLRKSEVRREPVELNGLVTDVARLLSSDAVIRNVTCTLELDPEPMRVVGDHVQLQQVVLNLLVNAMDAMSDCRDGDRTILVRTEKESGTVHATVRDAGPGLADGAESSIFEPFYTTKPTGMGMGLSIARSIVLAHGGRIWATRNPERGATFHLSLPLANGGAA